MGDIILNGSLVLNMILKVICAIWDMMRGEKWTVMIRQSALSMVIKLTIYPDSRIVITE